MDVELRQKALDLLLSQGVEVRLNTRLQQVGRDYITILEKGSDVEETIPVGITVWGKSRVNCTNLICSSCHNYIYFCFV